MTCKIMEMILEYIIICRINNYIIAWLVEKHSIDGTIRQVNIENNNTFCTSTSFLLSLLQPVKCLFCNFCAILPQKTKQTC